MKRIYLFMAVIAVLIFSCNSGTQNGKNKSANQAITMNEAADKVEDQKMTVNDTVTGTMKPPLTANYQDWDKKIIKTAEVVLELKNYRKYDLAIHTCLRAYGAYIAQEEQNFSDGRSGNSITIKVPVTQFDNLLNSLSGDSVKVIQKKITSEDVTGEVVDAKSRVEAKKQTRERYLSLLKQAKNMKEILEVQQEINAIQEEIESANGRVTFLSHQSAYSTIHLQYYQYSGIENNENNKPGYLTKLKEGFAIGWKVIEEIMVLIITIWPLIIITVIGIFLSRRKKKAAIINHT